MTARRLALIAATSAALIALTLAALAPAILRPREACEPLPSMFATHGQCVVVQEFYARRAG